MEVGIIGAGFVGNALISVFDGIHKLYIYDKYKQEYNSKENLLNLAKNAMIIFVSVPTPMKQSGKIDLTSIEDSLSSLNNAFKEVGRNQKEVLIVIRSTIVPGTTEKLQEKYGFHLAFNPEFLREKHAIEEMRKTDRFVLGVKEQWQANRITNTYKPIFRYARFLVFDTKTAELIKYAANTMLAGQVILANELYKICEAHKVDYNDVKEAILFDDRIGKNINVPGPDGDLGFGGKCFPKDLNALIYSSREQGYRPYLFEEIWRFNEKIRKNRDWEFVEGGISETNPDNKSKE